VAEHCEEGEPGRGRLRCQIAGLKHDEMRGVFYGFVNSTVGKTKTNLAHFKLHTTLLVER